MAIFNSPFTRILFPLILIFSFSADTIAAAKISYSDHCAAEVREYPTVPTLYGSNIRGFPVFNLMGGYFSGGGSLFNSNATGPPSFSFQAWDVRRTSADSVIKVGGTLELTATVPSGRNRLHGFSPRYVYLEVSGFWDENSGKLCMVSTGNTYFRRDNLPDLSAVVKLNYPKKSNINNSLVSGTVESINVVSSPTYFENISLLAYAQQEYHYMPESKYFAKPSGDEEKLGFNSNMSCGHLTSLSMERFELQNCDKGICGPFDRISGGFVPSYMNLNQIQCSPGGKVHMFIGFSNSSSFSYQTPIVPDKSLVAEGLWNQEGRELCLVACYINVTNSLVNASVGNCNIRLSLWFPAVLTLEKRTAVVGQLWSDKAGNDKSYFNVTSFRSLYGSWNVVPGVKYNYTKSGLMKKSCAAAKSAKKAGKRYPDGSSVGDMRFRIDVVDRNRKSAWGSATPLSIGETVYDSSNAYFVNFNSSPKSAPIQQTADSVFNVSYVLIYTFMNKSDAGEEVVISAEGVYNVTNGILCMFGCWQQSLLTRRKQQKTTDTMDCEIQINIELAPLNSDAGEHGKGIIRSMRNESHPRYFAPLEISLFGIYRAQAADTMWRIDIEITMVVVSLTLTCIFIGIQLFHVVKNPDVVTSISITMLVILTFGHMLPLVLNFEALFFRKRNRQNVLMSSGGWLEVNEVVVRVMTMVAFLLQFRFLQLVWSARSANEHKQVSWIAEKKALRFCVPLYCIGGFIAWFVHLRSYGSQENGPWLVTEDSHSIWVDLISYAGLILDGFLLPQVILNIFTNSKDRALNPVFYIGITVVRAMPHVYDVYRAGHYVPNFNSSYIYASPDGDLYSSTWDVIIPLGGLVFALLIFLQQRFGGSCILPPRFRKTGGYEIVASTILGSDDQAISTGIELK